MWRRTPETIEEQLKRLGLKPATEESLKNTYAVNNQGKYQDGVFRKATDPNPKADKEANLKKFGYY